jgi:hypothetical protein
MHPVGVSFSMWTGRQKDRRRDLTNLIVTSHNFANAPKFLFFLLDIHGAKIFYARFLTAGVTVKWLRTIYVFEYRSPKKSFISPSKMVSWPSHLIDTLKFWTFLCKILQYQNPSRSTFCFFKSFYRWRQTDRRNYSNTRRRSAVIRKLPRDFNWLRCVRNFEVRNSRVQSGAKFTLSSILICCL